MSPRPTAPSRKPAPAAHQAPRTTRAAKLASRTTAQLTDAPSRSRRGRATGKPAAAPAPGSAAATSTTRKPARRLTAPASRRAGHDRGAHERPVVVASAGRFARKRPPRNWQRIGVLATSGLLVAVLAWLVLASNVLAVHRISVLGSNRQSPASVRAALAGEVGRPLARVDLGVAAQKVVNLPAVRSVQVVRAWPTTLEVRLVERVPVAVVKDGANYALLDVDGVRLARVPVAPADLPVVSPATLAAGISATKAVVSALDQLDPAIRSQVKLAQAKTQDSVSFTLKSGATVVWGSSEQAESKAEVLVALLKIKAKVYDVSAPLTPVTR